MKAKTVLTTILIMLLIILLCLGGLFAYKKYLYKDTRHVGTWEREEDLTEYVRDRMQFWLGDAMLGEEADYGDSKVTYIVKLTLNEDGTYREEIDSASYEKACETAMELAKAGLYDFLTKRIEYAMPSYEGTADLPSLDEMMLESTGLTGEDYIKAYGPALLPTLTELSASRDRVGYYTVTGSVLAKSYGSAFSYETFVYTDNASELIITGITSGQDAVKPEVVSTFEEPVEVTVPDYTYPIVYKKK